MFTGAYFGEIRKPITMNWNMMLVDLEHGKWEARLPPLLHLPADVTLNPSVHGNFEFQFLFPIIKLPLMQKKIYMNRVTSSITEKSTSYLPLGSFKILFIHLVYKKWALECSKTIKRDSVRQILKSAENDLPLIENYPFLKSEKDYTHKKGINMHA